MSESTASLRRKIAGAGDLQSVVRTMKAVAASSIGQYEHSVHALGDYFHAVELGLGACFRSQGPVPFLPRSNTANVAISAVVFGSDQGLVGPFNDVVADFAVDALSKNPGRPDVWAMGDRVYERLSDAGLAMAGAYPVPNSVQAITPLVGRILLAWEASHGSDVGAELYLFHNRPSPNAVYQPVGQRLLPLDAAWRREIYAQPWPSANLPEVLGTDTASLRALLRGYLFVSLFRACAESLASENASRLAAMQRAEKNITELLMDLNGAFHRLRQRGIDEELFDVISGFELQLPEN